MHVPGCHCSQRQQRGLGLPRGVCCCLRRGTSAVLLVSIGCLGREPCLHLRRSLPSGRRCGTHHAAPWRASTVSRSGRTHAARKPSRSTTLVLCCCYAQACRVPANERKTGIVAELHTQWCPCKTKAPAAWRRVVHTPAAVALPNNSHVVCARPCVRSVHSCLQPPYG